MEQVKKILPVLSICLCALILCATFAFLPCNVASAEDANYVYASVADLNNNDYAKKSSVKLSYGDEYSFYIPESYYVIIGEQAFGNVYSATYMGEENFYIDMTDYQKVSVTFEDGVSPYPNVILKIKDGESVNISGTDIDNTYTITFFGYSEDNTSVFVKATKDATALYGMISISKINEFNVSFHSIDQAKKDSNNVVFDPNANLNGSTSKGIRIAIIVCLCVAAVIITLSIFLIKRKQGTIIKDGGNTQYDDSKE